MRRLPRSVGPLRQARLDEDVLRKRRLAFKLTGASALVVVALGVIAAVTVPTAIDKQTGCPLDDKPHPHTLIMVDATDRLLPRELNYAEALIRTEYLNLPLGGRLTVASIMADAETPSEIVVCRIAEKARTGDPTVNDRKIRQEFDKIAGVRLERLKTMLAEAAPQRASPIREMIAGVVDRPDFGGATPDRRLIILSDLAQHSDLASDYDRRFALSDEARDLFDRDMAGIRVRLHYVRRSSLSGIQGQSHKNSWTEALENMNADVAIGHDLNIGETAERRIWNKAS